MADRGAFAAGGLQNAEAFALEAVGGFMRTPVPGLARVVFLEARPGIDDQQRPDPIRMGAIEGKRHIAPERKPADDGASGADRIQQRRHVGNRQRLTVGGGDRRGSRTGRGRACPTARADDGFDSASIWPCHIADVDP